MDQFLKKEKFKNVNIKLESDGKQILNIFFSDSGAINRVGDGSNELISRFFMGRTEEPLFQAFIENFSDDLLKMVGRYEFPNPQGELCSLTITLEGDEVETGFEFTYGSESDGPPEEIVDLVNLALDLTDPWYKEQLNQKKRN